MYFAPSNNIFVAGDGDTFFDCNGEAVFELTPKPITNYQQLKLWDALEKIYVK